VQLFAIASSGDGLGGHNSQPLRRALTEITGLRPRHPAGLEDPGTRGHIYPSPTQRHLVARMDDARWCARNQHHASRCASPS